MRGSASKNGSGALFATGLLAASSRSRARAAGGAEIVDQAVFGLYLAALAWVPSWYGSNDLFAWGVNAVIFPGLLVVYELSLLARRCGHPVGLRQVVVPASMFAAVVIWIGLQTVDWPHGFPANPVWGMAAEALGRTVKGSISVDRDLTNLALLRLLTAASVFWLALQLCRDGGRARLLVVGIAVIGALYAMYGIVTVKTGPLPWLPIAAPEGKVTATFVSHNSFAAYAGICLIAGTGLAFAHFQWALDGASGSLRHQAAMLIEACRADGALFIAVSFVLLVALLSTGSRGGGSATACAAVMLGGLIQWRRPGRRRTTLIVVTLGLVAVIATGFVFGGVLGTSFEDRGLTDANRIAVYRLTIRSILDAPFLGFGYGTFPDVFRMYRDRSLSVDGIWGQAHDTYLEVFQGLGLVFGALLIGCVALLAFRCLKAALRRQENAVVPQVAASVACLVSVHSLIDFSLQIQAVAVTFMALLGAGLAQSESSRASLSDRENAEA